MATVDNTKITTYQNVADFLNNEEYKDLGGGINPVINDFLTRLEKIDAKIKTLQ